ncbi:nischarin [Folsomia candida]|uniref:Nischarin n=1 Tax=Folsomia candida TaxID=158441 RepID=A0A226E6G6_FOLCA|nr:nischarin [Folsomia candida]OXA53215.1 Nischarin [Folsomia candida]
MACFVQGITAYISGLVTDIHNTKDTAIWYKIQVVVKDVFWHVDRRYSDFEALHRKLVETQGIPRDNVVLPPKKLIGNKDPEFVEQRRAQLDIYLTNVLQLLGRNPPDDLAQFFNLHEYEIMFMLKKLAVDIFEKGDQILCSGTPFILSPYQIFAINERMKMAVPFLDSTDKRNDFTHIVDFCTNLKQLQIVGSNIPLGRSTIIPNQYDVDLSPFKSLEEISFKMANFNKIAAIGVGRETVHRISVQNSHLESTNELLLCDTVYKSFRDAGPSHVWPNLRSLHLSNNVIKSVEDIGKLAPKLRFFDLSFNQLHTVYNLTSLPELEHVSYSGNVLSFIGCDMNVLLGNVTVLNMSQNQIENLNVFSKLYSLTVLNLSCNVINDVDEVAHLSDLPCLEVLILTGNPVASTVDYRVRALAFFNERANDISLDNEKASLSEVDQISILQAIEQARRTTLINQPRLAF